MDKQKIMWWERKNYSTDDFFSTQDQKLDSSIYSDVLWHICLKINNIYLYQMRSSLHFLCKLNQI